jgi:hypothetical protein
MPATATPRRHPREATGAMARMSPEHDVQQHQHDRGYTEHPAQQVFAHDHHLKLCATRVGPKQRRVARRRRGVRVRRNAVVPQGRKAVVLANARTPSMPGRMIGAEVHPVQGQRLRRARRAEVAFVPTSPNHTTHRRLQRAHSP